MVAVLTRVCKYCADCLPQGYNLLFLSLQCWSYSGASIPIKRIRFVPISRLSPSMTLTGWAEDDFIQSVSLAFTDMVEAAIKQQLTANK